uniref:Transmembrane protein n=1 Tax=Setaria italica TaxID=4555 RepID=K3XZR8_SETIT
MASEASFPLLEGHDGSSAVTQLLRKVVAGCLVLLLLSVGVICSTLLLASPSSDSVCVNMDGPNFIKKCLLLIPIFVIVPVLCTSGLIREEMGSEAGALFLVEAISGVMLMEWLSICMCGASAWWVLSTGAVLVVALGTWAYVTRSAALVEA